MTIYSHFVEQKLSAQLAIGHFNKSIDAPKVSNIAWPNVYSVSNLLKGQLLMRFTTQSLNRVCLVLVLTSFQSVSIAAMAVVSLPEAIQLAFKNNPRSQAHMEDLAAEHEMLVSAKKKANTPTITIGASKTFYNNHRGSTDISDLPTRNRSNYIFINQNIFSSFADYYTLQAKECDVRQKSAEYNSTNTLIRNTKGHLAGLVSQYFTAVVSARQNIGFVEKKIYFISKGLEFAKTDAHITRAKNALSYYNIEKQELLTSLKINENNYKHVVREDIAEQVDTLDTTIEKIDIPNDAKLAFDLAKSKSPEILSAQLDLDCKKLQLEAQKAEELGFRVNVGAGIYRDRSIYRGGPYSSNNSAVTFTVEKSWNAGDGNQVSAADRRIRSAANHLEGATSDIENEIRNNYLRIESVKASVASYTTTYHIVESKLKSLIASFSHGQENDINFLVDLLNSYQGQWSEMDDKKKELINLKFYTQRSIGTLFEKIGD